MIIYKHITIILLFITVSIQSQTLVLETPEIPSPEKKLLYFLQEDLLSANQLKSNVVTVHKIQKLYNSSGKLLDSDMGTIRINKQPKAVLKQLPFKRVKDKIGIDSLVKKDKYTYELHKIDKDSPYLSSVYILTKDKITAMYDNSATHSYTSKYTYNKDENLIRIDHTDDYGYNNYVVKITYNKKGKVTHVKKLNNTDGTEVDITKYTYKNNLLTKVQTTSARYFFDQTTLKGEVEDIKNFDVYEDDDTFKTIHTTTFSYNAQQRLQKATIHRKGSSKAEGVRFNETETYELSYKTNQLMNFPEIG